MAITNGYATLAELRGRVGTGETYTSTGISFASATKKISDTNLGLAMFVTGDRITVSGSTDNDGTYTVATGGVAAEIVTSEALTTEAAGDTVIVSDVTDPVDDSALERAIEATSRALDAICGRRFYSNSSDETRYYTADEFEDDVFFCPDDIVSITTLGTDGDGDRTYEDTWTTNDYDLLPYNRALMSDSPPATRIEATPDGDYAFPVKIRKGIKIVGKFGWSSMPQAINEVTLLAAHRVFKRKDMPYGISGSAQLGTLEMIQRIKDDPELMFMLEPYMRTV